MAPIKFEEDMKNRLEKRTIEPSTKSWDTLSQRLDNEEKKTNKKGFWWLGIAASIVGVILVSNVFLNNETTNNQNTIIVEDNTKKDTLNIEIKQEIIPKEQKEIIVEAEKKPIIIKTKKVKTNQFKTPKVVVTTKKETKTIIEKQAENFIVLTENKTTSALAETKKDTVEKIKNLTVTDNEIDRLLAQATEAISATKKDKNTVPLDYNELLIAVEDDLDESFRDKLLKTIKKGYETVRESVAERNE